MTPTFPKTGVLDSFDRPDSKLGPNWSGATELHPPYELLKSISYEIKSNQAHVHAGGTIFWQSTRL